MKKPILFSILATMFIFFSACNKDDDNNEDPGNGGSTYSGINKVNLTIDGTTQEYVYADENFNNSETDASITAGTKNFESDSVYTEITMAAAGVFDHVTMAAMIVSYFGTGTGNHDISYGLEETSGLDNFSGSSFILLTDTSSMPIMYFLEEATTNITKYGEVGGYIEGTFESTVVSLAGVPQPNVSISGDFKAMRFDDVDY